MSARNYDYILSVADASQFVNSNILIGVSSQTTALIVNVNIASSTLKVKLSNSTQEFISGERVISNVSYLSSTNTFILYSNTAPVSVNSNSYQIDGSTNTFSLPSSNLTNFYTDSIKVFANDIELPKTTWTYPAISSLNKYGITFVPFTYTKTTSTDLANLKIKLNEVIKKNYFPNSLSQIVEDYSYLVPDTDLSRIFTGSAAEVTAGTQFTYNIPTANTSNIKIQLAYGLITESPYYPSYKLSEIETANTTITSIGVSTFIKSKNAFEQQPLVRLYTLYYPGEWYPAKESGNPSSEDADNDYPWPAGFPVRFAEVRGDYISDISYTVQYGGITYQPYPIDSTGINFDSSGKINDVTLSVSNFDSLITALVENAYLVGYNSSNNAPGIVNGELVYNIDPRTNPANAHFDADYSSTIGTNVAWTYTSTVSRGDTWVPIKQDTRDLLGGIVEIRTTFAHLLDYWPEYSIVLEKINTNYLRMRTTSPYRVGDIIHNNSNDMINASSVISQIVHPYIVVSNPINFNPGDKIYIQNPEASSEEFILDKFKINNLEGLDDVGAKFSLTSWLQYFKYTSHKRSFLKNSCPFVYGGEECQYPRSGTGAIPGSKKTANGFFTINNITTLDPTLDACARNGIACSLRNNEIHFGGFPGTGVSVPR